MLRLFSFLSVLLVTACYHSEDKKDFVYKVLSSDIENTTRIINQSNEMLYLYFNYQLEDPKTKGKITILLPAIKQIHGFSDSIVEQLNSIKVKIVSEEKGQNVISPDLLTLKNLYDSLVNFQSKMLNIDPLFENEFKYTSLISNLYPDTVQQPFKGFQHTFFSVKSNKAYIGLLSTLERRIRTLENEMLTFLSNRITNHRGCFEERYLPFLTQDKSIVSANDTIQIICIFCEPVTQRESSMTIEGSTVKANENGFMLHKLIAENTKGKHKVLVAIDFINPSSGEPRTISKTITYTVR